LFASNINVFALSFVIGVSSLIAIIDIALLKFLIYLSSFKRVLAPRIDRWIQDGVWQLQRRAYEAQGHRTWIDLESEIPRIDGKEQFKDLPITWVPSKNFDEESIVSVSLSREQSITVAEIEIEREGALSALSGGMGVSRSEPSRFRKFFFDLSHVL
jgi:hypothetical protein